MSSIAGDFNRIHVMSGGAPGAAVGPPGDTLTENAAITLDEEEISSAIIVPVASHGGDWHRRFPGFAIGIVFLIQGAADCGEYREAAGAVAQAVVG
jgi:hypothetical protein